MATPSTKRGTRLEGKKAIITGAAGYDDLSRSRLSICLPLSSVEVSRVVRSTIPVLQGRTWNLTKDQQRVNSFSTSLST